MFRHGRRSEVTLGVIRADKVMKYQLQEWTSVLYFMYCRYTLGTEAFTCNLKIQQQRFLLRRKFRDIKFNFGDYN